MPNKPMQPGPPQKVVLIPQQNQGQFVWKVSQNGGPPIDPGNASITIPKGTGPTQFTVSIAGNPANIKFKANNALTVWTGSKSAPQSGIDTQILGPVQTKDGDLVFYDLNQGDPVTLYYALHFEGTTPSVDPIVDNGGGVGGVINPPGGGGGLWAGGESSNYMMAAGIGILAGILLTLLVQRFMR